MENRNKVARTTLMGGMLIAVLITLFIGWSMLGIVSELKGAAALKARNHEVVTALHRLQINLTHAENTERGYLIGSDMAPAPYREAAEEVRWNSDLIYALTSKDPFQRHNAERLDNLVAAKLQTLQFLVDLRDAGSMKAAQLLMSPEQDRLESDRIRNVLLEMEQRENTLLEMALKVRDAAYGKLWWTLAATVLLLGGGAFWHYIRVRSIVLEAESSEARIRHLADHDALTGLPNRRLLQQRLDSHLADACAHRRTLAVLFLDLDGFKQVNDGIGHRAGDELLTSVAHRLRAAVRSSDTVARLGGDEFVIVLPELDGARTAAQIAHTLIESVAQPYAIEGRTTRVSASIGIGLYPGNGSSATELLANADQALNQAKADGKNRYRFAACG